MRDPKKMLLTFFTTILAFQFAHAADESASAQVDAAKSSTTSTTNKPNTSASTSVTASESASKTSSAPAQTYTVQVGNGDHKFKPDVVQAAVGDIIEFDFFPPNHSVVRAEYKFPCIPYEMTGAGKQGFFSGFNPVDAVLSSPPKYSLRINDTSPTFFYCSAPGSCITYGMVGVINPNSTTSLETHRKIALNTSYMLNPGEPFPAESPTPDSSQNSTSGSSAPSQNGAGHKLSTGAIAGIVVAGVGAVVLGGMLFFFWGRFKGLRDEMKRKESSVTRTTSPRSPAFFPWSAVSPHSQTPHSHLQTPHTAHSSNGAYDPKAGLSPQSYSTSSPMSAHANPNHNAIPPSYFPGTAALPNYAPPPHSHPPAHNPSAFSSSTPAIGLGIDRVASNASHRSVGGTFDLSQTTGYYTRTHEGADTYKYSSPHTSDMTSPVDPNLVPKGGLRDLQRLAMSKAGGEGGSPNNERNGLPGYFESPTGRPLTYHVNHAEGPVEMDDTSVQPPARFI
ncbi:hypothetical protein P280DRAFT_552183 [Massarina eburnea CBS 473.64]|uniref:Cupredoxin n=1 Tax=Massarina eburnea CBS 473.64 TaxID=1395130 RepID=A0A6A6RQY6_9PLEO|nr:hypothetical protein P280DRAFT_552183 [Massarina eburnea CBS 473.64]